MDFFQKSRWTDLQNSFLANFKSAQIERSYNFFMCYLSMHGDRKS